jgi:hypothetical protein
MASFTIPITHNQTRSQPAPIPQNLQFHNFHQYSSSTLTHSNPFKPIPKHKPVAILTHQTVLLPLQERKKKMQIRTEVREEPD